MRYLGIPIPAEVVKAAVLDNGVYGVLFEDPRGSRRCWGRDTERRGPAFPPGRKGLALAQA